MGNPQPTFRDPAPSRDESRGVLVQEPRAREAHGPYARVLQFQARRKLNDGDVVGQSARVVGLVLVDPVMGKGREGRLEK